MKKITLLLLVLNFSLITWAQNLVPNPSFEDTISCPNNTSQIELALGWSSYRATADYHNYCNYNLNIYQQPSTGNAYGALYTFTTFINDYREYLGCELISPLILGKKYFINFKVNLSDYSNCATNNIGVLFSTISYSFVQNWAPITNYSTIYSTNVVYDTSKWVTVSGFFISDSSYKYIMIGNFYDDINTTIDTLYSNNPNYAYYYIDDVCVTEDSLGCDFTINNYINNYENEIKVFPTFVSDNLYINTTLTSNYQISILNSIGKCIKKLTINNQHSEINLTDLAKGFYIITIETNNTLITKKIIKL